MSETKDDGNKYTKKYKGENAYITISDNEGDGSAYSIMLSISNEKINRDFDKRDMITSLERFINVSLRTVGAEETLRKLSISYMDKGSLVAIIHDTLKQYMDGTK